MLTAVIFMAAGLVRQPDASHIVRDSVCKPNVICGDAITTCPDYEKCVRNVANFVKSNGGAKTLNEARYTTQKLMFISQHSELLNNQAIDRTLSQMRALRGVVRTIPKWVFGMFLMIFTMVSLIFFLPALVIFVITIQKTNAFWKLLAVAGLGFIAGLTYFLVPM